MTTWQVEPLGQWTRPITDPRASSGRFRSTWQSTLDLLLDEIDRLQPTDVIAVRLNVDAGQVRRDGMLYARAQVDFPGVVVSFTSALHGPLTYATDAYAQRYSGDLPGWQANLRAIALSLEALRAVDRYGVTKSGEQYVGWRAIETGASTAGFGSADEALRWMRDQAGAKARTATPRGIYRVLVKELHPDVGGDPTKWDQLDEARQLLEASGLL